MKHGVRFAPSPTGDFHVGNLRTAWIAAWWAKALSLPLVFRFEDIDAPRVVPGARDRQKHDLATLGIIADREYLQTSRRERHWELFAAARASKQIYPCYCSRKEVQEALAGLASAPHAEGALYDGRCRLRSDRDQKNPTIAWRFHMPDATGRQDFIIGRTGPDPNANEAESDFVPAYVWACAIDDWDGKYELLVRATDLEHSLTQQRAVQEWIMRREYTQSTLPAVFHTALVTRNGGERLEKRTQGVTLAELEKRGISAADLRDRFRASFHAKTRDFAPAKVWSEEPKRLTLADLGL